MSCKCDTINIVNDNNVIVVSHADGRDGKSAYQQAVEGGYTGTEQEFNCSLSLLADVAEGKKQIADAINYKGGEAEPTQAFSTLAEEIKDIPNFDEYLKLACVLAGNIAMSQLEGQEQNIKAGNIKKIKDTFGIITNLRNYAFRYWNQLEEVELPVLQIPYSNYLENGFFSYCLNLKIARMPSTNFTGIQLFQNCSKLEIIEYGTLTEGSSNNILYVNPKPNLRKVIVGNGTNVNLNFSLWTATNVIAEGQSGVNELNENLYNNLLTKLYDHSTDGQTRTLRIGWLAYVTQENIDYANSKGWTLTT